MKLFSILKHWFMEVKEWIIWNTIERYMELSEETKKDIEKARADIKASRVYSLEEVAKERNIKLN